MPLDQDLQTFRETFQLDRHTVAEIDGWVLSTRPGQLTLGAMVLSAADGAQSFSDLSAQAAAGLSTAIARAETAAAKVFGADKFNAVCLMMKDPVVHFHLLPRYSQDTQRHGLTWTDVDWPGPPNFKGAGNAADEATVDAITAELRQALR